MVGRANARVAPSEGSEDEGIADGAAAGGFGCGGLRGTGAGKMGGAGGATYGGGGGMKFSFAGGGTTGVASTVARGSPVDGGGEVVLDVRERRPGLKKSVKPVPAGSFPAIPGAGGGSSGCGVGEPNTAVKSPTFFRGGSGWGMLEMAGVSNGRSPRNGP
jgi:hypothetical protein